jgi:hypothetical protein
MEETAVFEFEDLRFQRPKFGGGDGGGLLNSLYSFFNTRGHEVGTWKSREKPN